MCHATLACVVLGSMLCCPPATPPDQPAEQSWCAVQDWLTKLLMEEWAETAPPVIESADEAATSEQITIALQRAIELVDPWQAEAGGSVHVHSELDVNDDGAADFRIESTTSRGMLSTYYGHYRIVAIGNNRLLRAGRPLEPGEVLSAADLLSGTRLSELFTIGGSLRLLDEPVTRFSGGPWYDVDRKALAVAIQTGRDVAIGYVIMSVSERGEITIHHTAVTTLQATEVRIEEPPSDDAR